MHEINNTKTDARRLALLCLTAWHEKGTFIWDSLEWYKNSRTIEPRDIDFAYELACGTVRFFGYLRYVAKTLGALPKKPKERLLLFLALYQRLFLDTPAYAVVHTSVQLAKTSCSIHFSWYLNAVLQKELPKPTPEAVIRHSFPEFYINCLTKQYGKEKTDELLLLQNSPSPRMVTLFDPIRNVILESDSPSGYIQNYTPYLLVTSLAGACTSPPKRILDMCAAPGGKTVLLSKLFPEAHIVANDLAKKSDLLRQNINRFCPHVELRTGPGQEISTKAPFDLIVIDAPCSNSGVLYKCPEARFRLNPDTLVELETLQKSLFEHALTLVGDTGSLWYMTCSILQQENELFCQKMAHQFGLQIISKHLILPNHMGHDGGFGCLFRF